jgi:hypothetical protein
MRVYIDFHIDESDHFDNVEFNAVCRSRWEGTQGRMFIESYMDSEVGWNESLFEPWQNMELRKIADSKEVKDAILNHYLRIVS